MKILVTGGAGYLGSVLLPKLALRGHQIRVVDQGFFGISHLRSLSPAPQWVRQDLVKLTQDADALDELLAGVDAIIHLAAMSNDPTSELEPELTRRINTDTTLLLARQAKARGIKFLFASSCSVYGGAETLIDENGTVAPLTVYAKSKWEAEQQLATLKDEQWSPIILRFGTLFGFSTRMRFDLVINIFALHSFLRREITIFGGDSVWRPFLHVGDCARAITYFIEKKKLTHTTLNIAKENLTLADVSKVFREHVTGLKVVLNSEVSPDLRNYRVETKRMQEEGFSPRTSVVAGSEEILDALFSGLIADPESSFYWNVKWLKELGISATPPVRPFKAA